MNFAITSRRKQLVLWLVWLLVVVISLSLSYTPNRVAEPPVSALAASIEREERWRFFPWIPRWRWRKNALQRYRAWRAAYRRARRQAQLARLFLQGAIPLARIVEWVTRRQRSYQLGALPVLYALLETLQVREIINRHCSTKAEVDHGTVALVLILNRLMFPLPLYQIADWVGRTVLETVLGLNAAKFNDDRIERTLDALAPHLEAIWLEVTSVALRKAHVDLSVVFYDLTAFVMHGHYQGSQWVDFGFAHNTPSNKRKLKLALDTLKDGNIPGLYQLWKGRTADQATVQQNMKNLAQWLRSHGRSPSKTLVVSDRAMLSAEIAVNYDQLGLRYLSGMRCSTKQQRELLRPWDDTEFKKHPLELGEDSQYWGRECAVGFEHEGQKVTHKGLVVVSGPLRDQLRKSREKEIQALQEKLNTIQEMIGEPRLRSVKAVQRRVQVALRKSPVGRFMLVNVQESKTNGATLHWKINKTALAEVKRLDGRYLLVTNDRKRSLYEMFRLYRDKDGGEKRFLISKNDLRVSPVYLHKDQRIASMMLLNMIALLAYSILERQARKQGLALTSRQIIRKLQDLTLIETYFWDRSRMRYITPPTPEASIILKLVEEALHNLAVRMIPANTAIGIITSPLGAERENPSPLSG